MKKIKIVLLVLISAFSVKAKAQVTDTIEGGTFDLLRSAEPKSGTLVAFKKYKRFEGNWVWKSKNSELSLRLQTINYQIGKKGYYIQMLVGGVYIKNNGVVQMNTLDGTNNNIVERKDQVSGDDELNLMLSFEGKPGSINKFKNHPFKVKLIDAKTLVILPNKVNEAGVERNAKYNFLYNLKLTKQ